MSALPKIPPRQAPEDAESPEAATISDHELARRFTERHGGELRYVAAWGRWYLWDGRRWAHDERRRVFDLSRKLCQDVLHEQLAANDSLSPAQQRVLRQRLGHAATVWSIVKLASTDPQHAVSVSELDADLWVLNTPGGQWDLRSGTMRPHDPKALHTKITAATPGGDCPLFMATLELVLPDPAVRSYLQRLAGYALTGSSREHVLPFWWNTGRGAKSTIANAIRGALGDYAITIAAETLMESHHDRHPTELAALRGVRLAVGSEVDTGRRWNESRVKRLTGGDPISARYIGKDLFEFAPSHTLIIVGNAKPGLRQVDEAIRARLHLVEFLAIEESRRDPTVPERLQAEYGGILAWAIEGCLEWQKRGLAPPEAVRVATAAYLEGEDQILHWISERCERRGQAALTWAHRDYRAWCESNGATPLGRNAFGDQLEARGFKRRRNSANAVAFEGLELKSATEERYGRHRE